MSRRARAVVGLVIGVVGRGVRRNAGEEGRLGERQVRGRLVEVDPRSHLDAVGTVPEEDRVQIGSQNPVLRPAPLELPGERSLLQLAADRAVVLSDRVLHELLRDRRAALDDLLVPDVGPDRARDPAHVDAPMLPIAAVLDGDDRLLHHRSNLVGGHDHPALLAAQDREDRLAVGRVDVAVLAQVAWPGLRDRAWGSRWRSPSRVRR